MTHQRSFGGDFMSRGNRYWHTLMKISLGRFSRSIKIKFKGEIAIFYTMVAYKLELVHYEDDTLNFSIIRESRNAYPR